MTLKVIYIYELGKSNLNRSSEYAHTLEKVILKNIINIKKNLVNALIICITPFTYYNYTILCNF